MNSLKTIGLAVIAAALLFSLAIYSGMRRGGSPAPKDDFFSAYYLNPQPEKIPVMLKKFLASAEFRKQPLIFSRLTGYAYARLAAMYPMLLEQYAAIYKGAGKKQKLFLLGVFFFYRSPVIEMTLRQDRDGDRDLTAARNLVLSARPVIFSSFLHDVKPYDVSYFDYLWMEFSLTGDERPIMRIITYLATSGEVFAERMVAWIDSVPASSQVAEMKRILAGMDIVYSPDTQSLDYPGDLDCRYWYAQTGTKWNDPDMERLRSMLKFTAQDMVLINNKGALSWSLQIKARQHAKIRDILLRELLNRKDKATFEISVAYNSASRKEAQVFIPLSYRREFKPR